MNHHHLAEYIQHIYFKETKLLVPSTYFEDEDVSCYHCNELPQIYCLNAQMNLTSGSHKSQMCTKLVSLGKSQGINRVIFP